MKTTNVTGISMRDIGAQGRDIKNGEIFVVCNVCGTKTGVGFPGNYPSAGPQRCKISDQHSEDTKMGIVAVPCTGMLYVENTDILWTGKYNPRNLTEKRFRSNLLL